MYDFSTFLDRHPGGDAVLRLSRGTDVSSLFNRYHPRPTASFEEVLLQYRIQSQSRPLQGLDPSEREFLKAVHERLQSRERLESEGIQDLAFIVVVSVLLGLYVFLQLRALTGDLDLLPFAVFIALLRICLTTAGRYCLLSNTVFSFLSDLDYSCLTLTKMQVVLNQTEARIEKIWGLRKLPCVLRIPAFLICTLLFPLESIWTASRILKDRIGIVRQRLEWSPSRSQVFGLIIIRGILVFEFIQFCRSQKSSFWFSQFLMTSCASFVLLICDSEEQENPNGSILSLTDYILTEFPFLDCFLTAGLSCRQIHWLLPCQWSPFSNLSAESIVEEVLQEKGLQKNQSMNLISHRLPIACKYFLLEQEVPNSHSLMTTWSYFSNCLNNEYPLGDKKKIKND